MTSDDTPYDLPDGVPHQMMAGLLSFEASLALCDELLGGAVLGGACIVAVDGEMGECAPGKLVQYDASSCPLVEEGVRSSALLERGSFPGLVSQVE